MLLPQLLHHRALVSGLLNHLAADPPWVVVATLQLLAQRVLSEGSGVAPRSRASLWGDAALAQLALLTSGPAAAAAAAVAAAATAATAAAPLQAAALEGGEEQEEEEEEEGQEGEEQGAPPPAKRRKSAAAPAGGKPGAAAGGKGSSSGGSGGGGGEGLAVQAAYEMLALLLTDRSQGLAPTPSTGGLPEPSSQGSGGALTAPAQVEGAAAAGGELGEAWCASAGPQGSAGGQRALRLLLRLQPGDSPLHGQLLEEVAAAQPLLAVQLLAGLPYSLEPQLSGRWLACAATTARLVAGAARAPCPLLARMRSAGVAAAAGCAVPPPPGADAAVVRGALRRCLPPAATKVCCRCACCPACRLLILPCNMGGARPACGLSCCRCSLLPLLAE